MSSPKSFSSYLLLANKLRLFAAGIVLTALAVPLAANAIFPDWLQHILGGSTAESALYRAMQLPAMQALYPRPPQEAATELSRLIASSSNDAELYQLRARAHEQALDEPAAESDWKLYVVHAPDSIAGRLELADFYERRLMIPQEIATLRDVAAAPPLASETYLDPTRQRSWLAFERILGAISQQGLPPSETTATFDAFLARYPDQPAVYAAFLQFNIDQQQWPAAQSLITRYSQQFPGDRIFPVRAEALLEFHRGDIDAALSVYDRAFEPLWPTELIESYFALLDQTHRQRAFVATARQQLAAHPDGPEALNALARIFYYDQQAGRTTAAQQTLDSFRIARDARSAAWTPADLYTLANLSLSLHSYAEAARYNYALAASTGTAPNSEPAPQAGLAGLVDILLQAPDQPLAIGAQNLTLYRDIATLDQGPGYWNGILSLWLNGENPESAYQTETSKAQSYFHRAKAAELLADLDQRFPNAPERPALHAQLIRALSEYGEPSSTIAAGKQYLTAFPSAPGRFDVANLMADAYARQNDTSAEFALYESLLNELAIKTAGLPLTSSSTAPPPPPQPGSVSFYVQAQDPDSVNSDAASARSLSFQPLVHPPTRKSLPEGNAYSSILDRYLSRLIATNQLPRALTVLRTQLDRNPNDPLLYERLATFFEQNNISAEQEQIDQQAISKFQQASYYDKLARLYLREKKREAFGDLAKKVTDIFSGTDLDVFFTEVNPNQPIGPQLALQLNLYAARRFPHDLVFTRNLLTAYQAPATRDTAAYEALLRREWYESDDLREQFLTYLSRTGKLESELSQLKVLNHQASSTAHLPNPAALREQAEIDIFTSHFEQAAPLLGSVADLYPADADTGDRAISLYRSLAYLDPQPSSTLHAVALEQNLLSASPNSPDRLATLGDLYAESTRGGGENLASAAPIWRRIPELHPNSTQGYLTTATIFWDYFQFDDALAEVTAARTRFHSPSLFGFEAGAIEENRHNLPAAIAEYTSAVIHPIEIPRHFDSALGVIDAWLKPPSDAADSNFRSTAQSFLGSGESNARLLQLASRPATKAAVDAVTERAVFDNPANIAALTLRGDVLAAQHHSPELNPLLTTLFTRALDHSSTLDEAAAIGTLAQDRGLTAMYQRSLARQVTLTVDPVQKIELQYSLARSLESHDDIPGATHIIASVYSANPRILGVVRATTDFYARTNHPERSISTLLDAAKVANPALSHDFILEAASRANDANDTAQARTLVLPLLAQTPDDARVLDVIATSYARAHDDAGLKQFYLAQLDAAHNAPNTRTDARKQRIARLRRGLIPALTRLKDFSGATDQYIALLSAFPEDASLGQQAALYALQHSRQSQLLEFLGNSVKQSPRDSRFMIQLAAAESTFDDLPAAESAYSLALAIRKDRVDLYTARAAIELRLGQNDPAQSELAAADFQRLYALSYHDPAWMLRLAELRARQQRPRDAVKALQTAYIEGHVQSANDYFTIASHLEQWNLLTEARTFAERAVALAGADLLTPSALSLEAEADNGAIVYARILARSGQADRALATLASARHAAELSATSPTVLAAELARENISGDEAAGFRQNFAMQRRQTAEQNLRAAIDGLGKAIRTYDTPEQKQAFALTLDRLHDPAQPNANPSLALQAATAAGLADREANWRKQALPTDEPDNAQLNLYVALQQRRLQFSSLAHDLEAFAARVPVRRRSAILVDAAQAFRAAGDPTGELRLERPLVLHGNTMIRDRYFDLLLHHDPSALAALAGGSNAALADAALNYTIAHGTEAQALAAVASHGQSLQPVWRPASASLVQTYFANSTATAADVSNFDQSLGANATIGDRLAARPDPTHQLTGDTFFYYASRFGIFLSTVHDAVHPLPNAEDFLPAELEGSPESPTPYLNLARTYADAHRMPSAVAEYNHALEISPSDPAIEDELADTLYRANRHDAALTHWRQSLAILTSMQQQGRYPETWFTSFVTIVRHLGNDHLTAVFRPELKALLGPYLSRNGTYRSNELLRAVYQASATPTEGADLILTVVDSASDPNQILDDINRKPWLSAESRESILRRQIELLRAHPSSQTSNTRPVVYQTKLITLYLDGNAVTRAQAIYDALPEKDRAADPVDAIILAVRSNRLKALIEAWRANPESAPKDSFNFALFRLMKPTLAYKPDRAAIRPLREFVFDFKRQNHTLIPTDFLALAQIRIDTGDQPGALDLLHQLTLQPASTAFGFEESDVAPEDPATPAAPTNPYINTDQAASLLEKNHLALAATPLLQSLVQSVPWDASCRLRLARAQLASNARDQAQTNLLAVARDPSARYDLRVEAAHALSPLSSQSIDLGSPELSFIAHPSTLTAARQPYADEARIAAATLASTSVADREMLLREAVAISPYGPDTNRVRLDLLLLQSSNADSSATLGILHSIENPTSIGAGDPDAVAAASSTISLPSGSNALDLPTRIRLATLLSFADERNGDVASALSYAQLAVELAKNSPQIALTRRRDDLKVAVLLAQRNLARRPQLHAALTQSIEVRPRLTASNLSPEDSQ